MAKPDGGPAFPRPASEDTSSGTLADGNVVEESQQGMSLRDYFAAKAIAALIDVESTAERGDGRCTFSPEVVAIEAYRIADWMLVERAK